MCRSSNRWLCASGGLLLALSVPAALGQSPEHVVNGGFEEGLRGWQAAGAVCLETNRPVEGKASAVLGPGAGSLTQRIETGSGNAFTLSATIQSQHTNGWSLALRFLDKESHELMRVDSIADLHPTRKDPRQFSHYMKAHPLTKWVELIISKDVTEGLLLADQVSLDMPDENAASLQPTGDLDQAMQPFWLGRKVYHEAVLMLSQDGKAATGRLMFQPTRIISVQDYGLGANYREGADYTVDGRTLTCTARSRMSWVREEDLPQGELNWSVVGGKQVTVTYEHKDAWPGPSPAFAGDGLPGTMKKLKARAPLILAAYGDSITHGLGESRLSHIQPFLPPWPELVVHRLQAIYHDEHIRLYNSAQSGADSKWGKEYAERMVGSLHPDLVIIAFGQNDFWSLSPSAFADNMSGIISAIRKTSPATEFLLVSTMRFDPAYTSQDQYWNAVSEYALKLKAMTSRGVQFVDMTALSEAVFAAKKPKDCLNDPLHPNDYLARWYAQCVVAALDPASGRTASKITR